MAVEWWAWCKRDHLTVDGSSVVVRLDRGRSHRVEVVEQGDGLDLSADVITRQIAESIGNLPLRILHYNRSVQLVTFHIDGKGAVVARSRVPARGLAEASFQKALCHLATEADRLEYLLSGKDEH
jgi:hypothetical protein